MGRIHVGTLGDLTAAGIQSGDALERQLIPSLTSLASVIAGGGIGGALVGVLGGVAGALFSRRNDERVKVEVDEYSSRALRQRQEEDKGKTTFILRGQGGLLTMDWLEDQLVELKKRGFDVDGVTE